MVDGLIGFRAFGTAAPHPRRSRRAACRREVFAVLVLVAASVAPLSAAATPAMSPAAAARTPLPAVRNRVMGSGEAPRPEPFTIEQRLLDAVRRNDRPTIERALQRGASIHSRDDIGRSTVFLAVFDAHDLDLVRWLHGKGARLDEPDTGGRTALSFAAANGRVDIVEYLVANGAVVDRRDKQGRTALFHAVLNDRRDAVDFLLNRGADVNVHDQFGDTPLIVACAKGFGDMAKLLLARGADPSLRDQEGRTAAERGAGRTEACKPPTPPR